MPGLAGRPGSWGGLVLRVGQAVCVGACVGVMGSSLGFASYTAFLLLACFNGAAVAVEFGTCMS